MTLPESELNKIREEAEKEYPEIENKGFSTYDRYLTAVSIQFGKIDGYIAALTSERERTKELVEALEKISIDKYPESVFKPITDDEWSEIVKYIQRRYSIDQISGYYGRFFHKLHRDIAQAALSNHSNNQKKEG